MPQQLPSQSLPVDGVVKPSQRSQPASLPPPPLKPSQFKNAGLYDVSLVPVWQSAVSPHKKWTHNAEAVPVLHKFLLRNRWADLDIYNDLLIFM